MVLNSDDITKCNARCVCVPGNPLFRFDAPVRACVCVPVSELFIIHYHQVNLPLQQSCIMCAEFSSSLHRILSHGKFSICFDYLHSFRRDVIITLIWWLPFRWSAQCELVWRQVLPSTTISAINFMALILRWFPLAVVCESGQMHNEMCKIDKIGINYFRWQLFWNLCFW